MLVNEWENVKIICKNTKINGKEGNDKFQNLLMELLITSICEDEGSQSFSSCQIMLGKFNKR